MTTDAANRLLAAALAALDGLLTERQTERRPSMALGSARYVARLLREAGVQPAGAEARICRADVAQLTDAVR